MYNLSSYTSKYEENCDENKMNAKTKTINLEK